jgi:hypothetical protein
MCRNYYTQAQIFQNTNMNTTGEADWQSWVKSDQSTKALSGLSIDEQPINTQEGARVKASMEQSAPVAVQIPNNNGLKRHIYNVVLKFTSLYPSAKGCSLEYIRRHVTRKGNEQAATSLQLYRLIKQDMRINSEPYKGMMLYKTNPKGSFGAFRGWQNQYRRRKGKARSLAGPLKNSTFNSVAQGLGTTDNSEITDLK